MAWPLALGVGAWGCGLLSTALADPRRRRRFEIDLEEARRSPAVQRFDALYGPKAGTEDPTAPPKDEGGPTASG